MLARTPPAHAWLLLVVLSVAVMAADCGRDLRDSRIFLINETGMDITVVEEITGASYPVPHGRLNSIPTGGGCAGDLVAYRNGEVVDRLEGPVCTPHEGWVIDGVYKEEPAD